MVLYGNIKDCPGFETFGADVKEARKVKQLSRKTLAEQVNIDWRYLANIENDGTIPSLPVIIQLIKICGLPVERILTGDHAGGKRTAAAGQPQAETLPGRISAGHRGRD